MDDGSHGAMRIVPTLLMAAALLSSGCHTAEAPPPSPVTPTSTATIVAFGDSLTAGYGIDADQAYPAQLERSLRASGHAFRVVNAGSSGETSSGSLGRVAWTLKMHPDLVILETGANDGLRGLDPKVTQDNLVRIIDTFKQNHVAVLLCGMRMVANLGTPYTTAFAAIYPTVAAQEHVPLMAFFLDGVGGVPALNLEDGLHPTAEGYAIIVKKLEPLVVSSMPAAGH